MEKPIPTITKEVLQDWEKMSAKWCEETTWPSLEEARATHLAADKEHEFVSYRISDLELQIDALRHHLNGMSERVFRSKGNTLLDKIAAKATELVSCEDRLILLDQRVQRYREIYEYLRTVQTRKLHLQRFPNKPCPLQHSKVYECPSEDDGLDDSENHYTDQESDNQEDDANMDKELPEDGEPLGDDNL